LLTRAVPKFAALLTGRIIGILKDALHPVDIASRRLCHTDRMPLGRVLIFAGLALVAAGVLVTFAGRLPIKLGRLPGDIYIQGKNSSLYFPLVTCLLLSALLSLVMWIFRR
jgi:hypothetical protein